MTDYIKNINTSIQFTDMSTNTPTSWLWSFGDGEISTYQNPTHIYTTIGIYNITEISSNICGPSTSITKTIEIQQLTSELGGTQILGLGLLFGVIYLSSKKK